MNDALKFFVEVESRTGLLLTPPKAESQVEAGGKTNYQHILKNTSNHDLFVKIKGQNAWSHRIVSIKETAEASTSLNTTPAKWLASG